MNTRYQERKERTTVKFKKSRYKQSDEVYKLAGALARDLKQFGWDKEALKEECKLYAKEYDVDSDTLENKVNGAYISLFV